LAKSADEELEPGLLMLITAIFAWRIVRHSRGLATLFSTEEMPDIVVATHRLPGCERLGRDGAFWTDVSIKKLLRILYVKTNARTMVPIPTTSLAFDHHAMIIRATANTVFATIIALRVGSETSLRARGLTGAIGGGRSTGFVCMGS
jgi:hypothetical protein